MYKMARIVRHMNLNDARSTIMIIAPARGRLLAWHISPAPDSTLAPYAWPSHQAHAVASTHIKDAYHALQQYTDKLAMQGVSVSPFRWPSIAAWLTDQPQAHHYRQLAAPLSVSAGHPVYTHLNAAAEALQITPALLIPALTKSQLPRPVAVHFNDGTQGVSMLGIDISASPRLTFTLGPLRSPQLADGHPLPASRHALQRLGRIGREHGDIPSLVTYLSQVPGVQIEWSSTAHADYLCMQPAHPGVHLLICRVNPEDACGPSRRCPLAVSPE